MSLHHLIEASVRNRGSKTAVIEALGSLSLDYATLGRLSDQLRDRLAAMGVGRGDRVGIYLRKSIDSVAAIFGILKSGAAYVPVDPTAPPSRNAYIHANCAVKVVVIEHSFVAAYLHEWDPCTGYRPQLITIEKIGGGCGIESALAQLQLASPAPAIATVDSAPDDLAYILYTSGSTGKPKGVMLTHRNAVSFVDWCSQVFSPRPDDVFSSHAPLHFDLSILDLYVPLKHGASLVLIGESSSKDPLALSRIISRHHITIWYSAPSILSLMAQFGKIAEHDFSSLRTVLFAGEVFPVVHLRSFKRQVPTPRLYNLYGPTETNVCTYYEIPPVISDDRVDPYPIGQVCENLLAKVVDADAQTVRAGAEGELCIAGPNVMQGYWALPELTRASFLSASDDSQRWYKTGDIVVGETGGIYRYVGRRDRMIKKRGYRVELGEIEACLYRHAAIREAAVIALPDDTVGMKVKAHLSIGSQQRPSLIELKTFCSKHLPLYMVPDVFAFHDALPKTSTDKIDYQTLKGLS